MDLRAGFTNILISNSAKLTESRSMIFKQIPYNYDS